jgi:hypothetical protein
MYCAYASGNKGLTRLHMDLSGAVNILLHSSQDESSDAAEWWIWEAEHAGRLREYMRETKSFKIKQDEDPIHSQQHFLTEKDMLNLKQRGIAPVVIRQRVGDAIFIPARCPHQVKTLLRCWDHIPIILHQVANKANCIKIAMDFVCEVEIARCIDVTTERSLLEASRHVKTDVLQVKDMLWYTYVYLNQHNHFDPIVNKTRKPRVKKDASTAAVLAQAAPTEAAPAETATTGATPTETAPAESALTEAKLTRRPRKKRRTNRQAAQDHE